MTVFLKLIPIFTIFIIAILILLSLYYSNKRNKNPQNKLFEEQKTLFQKLKDNFIIHFKIWSIVFPILFVIIFFLFNGPFKNINRQERYLIEPKLQKIIEELYNSQVVLEYIKLEMYTSSNSDTGKESSGINIYEIVHNYGKDSIKVYWEYKNENIVIEKIEKVLKEKNIQIYNSGK